MAEGSYAETLRSGASNHGARSTLPRNNQKSRAPQGLNFPNNIVPNTDDSKEPHYVFILTNAKTFDELFRSKHPERGEFVLHSLRRNILQCFEKKSPLPYDEKVDECYKDKFEKISPGLSGNSLDHRKHQYHYHGYATGLNQTQYFDNMIKLYDHFDINETLRNVARNICGKRTEEISKHKWTIVDAATHASRLREQLCNRHPGICYALSENEELKFDYQYFLYLNEKFEIMDAPPDRREETLKGKYIPITTRHFTATEKA